MLEDLFICCDWLCKWMLYFTCIMSSPPSSNWFPFPGGTKSSHPHPSLPLSSTFWPFSLTCCPHWICFHHLILLLSPHGIMHCLNEKGKHWRKVLFMPFDHTRPCTPPDHRRTIRRSWSSSKFCRTFSSCVLKSILHTLKYPAYFRMYLSTEFYRISSYCKLLSIVEQLNLHYSTIDYRTFSSCCILSSLLHGSLAEYTLT